MRAVEVLAALVAMVGVAAGEPPAPALRLEQAIQLALTRNERAAIADLDVVIADAGVDKARVAFLPVLQASGNDTLHPRDTPIDTAQRLAHAEPAADRRRRRFRCSTRPSTSSTAQRAQTRRRQAPARVRRREGVLQRAARRPGRPGGAEEARHREGRPRRHRRAGQGAARQLERRHARADRPGELGARARAAIRAASTPRTSSSSCVVNARVADGARARRPRCSTPASSRCPPPTTLVAPSLARRPDLAARKERARSPRTTSRASRACASSRRCGLVGQLTATLERRRERSRRRRHGRADRELDDLRRRRALRRRAVARRAGRDRRSRRPTRSCARSTRRSAPRRVAAASARSRRWSRRSDAMRRRAQERRARPRSSTSQGLAKAIELSTPTSSGSPPRSTTPRREFSVANAYLALRQAMGLDPLGRTN